MNAPSKANLKATAVSFFIDERELLKRVGVLPGYCKPSMRKIRIAAIRPDLLWQAIYTSADSRFGALMTVVSPKMAAIQWLYSFEGDPSITAVQMHWPGHCALVVREPRVGEWNVAEPWLVEALRVISETKGPGSTQKLLAWMRESSPEPELVRYAARENRQEPQQLTKTDFSLWLACLRIFGPEYSNGKIPNPTQKYLWALNERYDFVYRRETEVTASGIIQYKTGP